LEPGRRPLASTSPSRDPSSTRLARELYGSLRLGQVELVAQSVVLTSEWLTRAAGAAGRADYSPCGDERGCRLLPDRPSPRKRRTSEIEAIVGGTLRSAVVNATTGRVVPQARRWPPRARASRRTLREQRPASRDHLGDF